MSKFSELLANPKAEAPAVVQRRARVELADRLRQSSLHPWSPQPVSALGTVAIVGIASYSPRDLELLDELDQFASSQNGAAPIVTVFDCLDCQKPEDFDRYIPGLTSVTQTPVAGIWRNGKLISRAQGIAEVKDAFVRLAAAVPGSGITVA